MFEKGEVVVLRVGGINTKWVRTVVIDVSRKSLRVDALVDTKFDKHTGQLLAKGRVKRHFTVCKLDAQEA